MGMRTLLLLVSLSLCLYSSAVAQVSDTVYTEKIVVGGSTSLPTTSSMKVTNLATSGGTQTLFIDPSVNEVIRRVIARSDLPSAIAYEDETNVFTVNQTFNGSLIAGAANGVLSVTGAVSATGVSPIVGLGFDNVRMGKRTTFDWPMIILEDAGFPQWSMHNDSGTFFLYRRDISTGNPPDDPSIALQINGNVTFGPYGKRLLPATPYGVDIGSQQYKFGALWVGDLFADTLVTIENIGTIDNRWLIGSGNVLDEDLSPSATSMVVRYNNYASGTFVYLQKFARTEFIKTTSGATATNKIVNGSFETGVGTNWSGDVSTTISVVTTKSFHGEHSLLVDASSNPSTFFYTAFNFVTGNTYTVCLNARRVDGATIVDGAIDIFMRDSFTPTIAQQTLTDGWVRVCRTAAAGSNGTQILSIDTNAVDMYIDAIQVEETSTQRPYSEYRASYSIARNQDSGVANQWYAGDGMMGVGSVSGDGWLDCYAIRGIKSATEQGPACVANVRTGSAFNDWAPYAAWGNLDGLYGISGTRFGFRAGRQTQTTIGADTSEGFTIKNNGTMKMQFDTSGNGFLTGDLTIGTSGVFRTAGATALDTGTGFYMAGGTTPVFRVGIPGSNRIRWDGSNLEVRANNLIFDSGGITVISNNSTVYANSNAYTIAGSVITGGTFGMGGSDTTGVSRTLHFENVHSTGTAQAGMSWRVGNGGVVSGITFNTVASGSLIFSNIGVVTVNAVNALNGAFGCGAGQALKGITLAEVGST